MSNVHDNSTGLHCLHCWVVTVFKIWSQSSELKIGPAQVRFASSLGFFFSPLILVSAFRPLLMLGTIHDTFAFFLHTEDTAFLKAQLGRLWQAMLLHALPLSFTPLSSSHFLPISLYRARVGWGAMTPSLSLFPPHLME